jgi:hypothetical protein
VARLHWLKPCITTAVSLTKTSKSPENSQDNNKKIAEILMAKVAVKDGIVKANDVIRYG